MAEPYLISQMKTAVKLCEIVFPTNKLPSESRSNCRRYTGQVIYPMLNAIKIHEKKMA